ncbi:Hypothetical predicted protein [Mytilus galloprovincialis]|uniref:Uncharacterized protein n=1 Tax=Mytilus galloprovincialis TaxID=29158 RepID=A0A8B6FJ59_MYTGA|nr:Hypothetical predicted protein [Mytilus galloprovincialis]
MRGDMGTENGLVAVMQTLFAGDENELDDTAQVWNTHYIRSREYVFHGRPVNMYLYPDLFNAEEHIRQVDDHVLHFCRSECAEEDEYPCEEEIFELGCIYMEENLLKPPENVDQSRALYLSLRRWFIQQL